MVKANELRVGNQIKSDGIVVTVDARTIFDIWDSSKKYDPIELTPELLDQCGFEKPPHFTVQGSMRKPIGRDRVISIGCVGTPNEMIFLTEEEPPKVKDVVVLRNFDYDGKTYLHQLQNLYFALTGEELKVVL